ncbi:hypothetical protein JM66_13490 [Aeromonas bestiarum]|nr:hypothetical protein JM66_13490 [Aeromonas bestiarum]
MGLHSVQIAETMSRTSMFWSINLILLHIMLLFWCNGQHQRNKIAVYSPLNSLSIFLMQVGERLLKTTLTLYIHR